MKVKGFLAVLTVVWPVLFHAPPASAHPLGNFTVNTFSDLKFSTEVVHIDYAVDLAEIPTFQLDESLGLEERTDRTNKVESFFSSRLGQNLDLEVADTAVPLELTSVVAMFNPGQGGLETIRVDLTFEGKLPSESGEIRYQDRNYFERVGWREIVIRGVDGQGISSSSVRDSSISNGLRAYPKDLLASPPRVLEAAAQMDPDFEGSAAPQARDVDQDTSDTPSIFGNEFASLIERDPSPGVIVVALLLALLFGAVHALGPGHGKTVMAAYLVGAEGRPRQAVIIGIAVSLMHTTSVVILGLITLAASSVFAPESVYPWLSFVSGLVVLGLGGWLLRTRLGARFDRGHDHEHHGHEHHNHEHHAHESFPDGSGGGGGGAAEHARAHALGMDHSHGTLPAGVPLLSARGIGAIAVSGGLLPSPSALVVLLGAVALHRVAFGIALVAAFSVGLAGALTIVGILVLKARHLAARRSGARVSQLLPILSAASILIVGLFLTGQAVRNLPF